MKVDAEKKKIALSIRRAQPAHWDGIVDKYQVGEVVPGIVTKLATFGAFARIEGPVEGLIHVSELVDRRIAHSQEAVREGDILPLKIIRIERDRHRLGLSLKQARDRGEMHGLQLQPDGEVTYVPPEIKEAFQDEVDALHARGAPKPQRGARDRRAARRATSCRAAMPQPSRSRRLLPARSAVRHADREGRGGMPQTQMAAAFAALNLEQSGLRYPAGGNKGVTYRRSVRSWTSYTPVC